MAANEGHPLLRAVLDLEEFTGQGLTARIASLEKGLRGMDVANLSSALSSLAVTHELLRSADLLKRLAGQINVVIHALGILLSLPHILEPGERVESLSLGAGNTGRQFDLETTIRVAEFKFIHWQRGSEVIRQNALFKDFYLLAESETPKRRHLFVLGTEHPLRFLESGRSLTSVMSRHRGLWNDFTSKYSNRMTTVREYYALKRSTVAIQDIARHLPELARLADTELVDTIS